jgi:hypothetical protein
MEKFEETKPAVYERFLRGLDDYGLTRETVLQEWIYCGSNQFNGEKFHAIYPDCKLPEFEGNCICGQKIEVNHYITDGDGSILIIGSECIKKFLQFSMGKRCTHCRIIHKNRKDNYCNACRKIPNCKKCGKKGQHYCKECREKESKEIKIANQKCFCGKKKREEYSKCYTCQQEKNEKWKKLNNYS